MRILRWIDDASLTDGFPLQTSRPFTTAMAAAAGLTRRNLADLVAAGLLRRPVPGVYLSTALGDSLALRAECLRLVAPEDCVVVDRHAGWLHGAEMVLAPGEHLEVRPLSLFRPSGAGRLRNEITASGERSLRPEDIAEIDGLRATTPLRTAWDLGRVRWPSEAISGIDAMLRLEAFDTDEFLAGVERFKGQRWVSTLRAVAPLGDGRAESPGESVLRLRCLENQLRLTPQVEVFDGPRFVARLDLADPDLRAAAEYDGAEWHSTPEQRRHDADRRADARDCGYLIEVFTKDDLFTQAGVRDVDRRIRDVRRAALARRGARLAG